MMWVLVGIAAVELIVVHLLIALLWSPVAAAVVSLVSLSGVGWLVWTIASFKRLPVRLEADRLVMRVGRLRRIDVPLGAIAGLRREWDAASLKARGVARLSLVVYPNIVLDLTGPLPGRRGVTAVAHRLDDPTAFVATLAALGVGHV